MLKDKSIVVTGGGAGIGKVTCELFARDKARIVVSDIDVAAAEATAQEIRKAGGEALAFGCNVTNEDEVAALMQYAVEHYGTLDGAFNNAGVEMTAKPIHELSAEEFRHVIDVDLNGVFYCTKHAILAMKDRGGGSIVNMASAAGLRGTVNAADYIAAKHGVVGLTKGAAADVGKLGIRVNAICPGLTMTPAFEERLAFNPGFTEALEQRRQRHYIGRFGQPLEIARAVQWLLSDLASFTTGAALSIDGGYTI